MSFWLFQSQDWWHFLSKIFRQSNLVVEFFFSSQQQTCSIFYVWVCIGTEDLFPSSREIRLFLPIQKSSFSLLTFHSLALQFKNGEDFMGESFQSLYKRLRSKEEEREDWRKKMERGRTRVEREDWSSQLVLFKATDRSSFLTFWWGLLLLQLTFDEEEEGREKRKRE